MRIKLEKAVQILSEGDIAAVPTETVYGLAASLYHPKAIEKIFFVKGRPSNNPLIIHLADPNDLKKFVRDFPSGFDLLTRSFWPGPLTLVLPLFDDSIPSNVRAGLPTAAFRVPDCPLALALLQKTGPLVMPSANLSGRPSATCPEHVEADFGANFPVLDGGACRKGVESTILIHNGGQWRIIRQGALAAEDFNRVLNYVPLISFKEPANTPLCPGQLYRHYAPKARLILSKKIAADAHSVILGFSGRTYPDGAKIIIMGSAEDPIGVAEQLYAILRQLDDEGVKEAGVDFNIPEQGLWATIAERLKKASQE
jgi:L-threonylcarbamoyladenylate synthase